MNKPQHFTSHDHRWLYKPEKPHKPQRRKHHDDTFRTFPRTLVEAFPDAPYWPEETPLGHKVVPYALAFAAGFVVCLLVMGL